MEIFLSLGSGIFLDKNDRKRNFLQVRMIQLIKRCLFWKMRALSTAIERWNFSGEMGIEFKLFLPAAFATSVVKIAQLIAAMYVRWENYIKIFVLFGSREICWDIFGLNWDGILWFEVGF